MAEEFAACKGLQFLETKLPDFGGRYFWGFDCITHECSESSALTDWQLYS